MSGVEARCLRANASSGPRKNRDIIGVIAT